MLSRSLFRRFCISNDGLFNRKNGSNIINQFTKLLSSKSSKKDEPAQSQLQEDVTNAKRYVPRRALLYVPGDDERKINKATTIDVDCIVFDCEDGVAANKKDEARNLIQKTIQTLTPLNPRTELAVRINSVESGFGEDDLKVLFSGEKVPHTVLLPKVENKEHLDWFAEKLVKSLGKRKINDINLITYVESAKGLLDLRDICNHAIELSEFNLFFLDGIVFGSDDFCANIGATRTQDASEISLARQQVVITAKAFDLQAIDLVYIDFKDLEGLKRQAIEGAQLGFTGKQAIHPDQVPIIQEAFRPSKERIQWANELIKEFNEHQKEGKGAFVFRGQMIDKPLLLQAQNIIQIVKAIDSNNSNNNNNRSTFISDTDKDTSSKSK